MVLAAALKFKNNVLLGNMPWVSESERSSKDLVRRAEGTYSVSFIQLFLKGLSLSSFK